MGAHHVIVTMSHHWTPDTRKWGEVRDDEVYIAVEGPGNPYWERKNPQANPDGGSVPPKKGDLDALCGDLERVKSEKEAEKQPATESTDDDEDPPAQMMMKAQADPSPLQPAHRAMCCRMLGMVNGREDFARGGGLLWKEDGTLAS